MAFEKEPASGLIAFYLGEKPDIEGRMIRDIWAWDFEELECAHDYIQWLFPICEKSSFNPNAPIVDRAVIQAFRQDLRLIRHLRRSLKVMLSFYGLQEGEDLAGETVIKKSEHYAIRREMWLHPFDHNYLRLTRILKCLMLLGAESEAQALSSCLHEIYREDGDRIGSETLQYWKNAVS